MQLTLQRERAEEFHRLHAVKKPLVLINAWDAASAKLFEQAGSAAIATTSAGIAWSLGYSDGEQMNKSELIQACERICRVVTSPVSVDIERGFGRTPAEVCETVRALLELGVVGVNIEDGITQGTAELAPPAILAKKISAIRALADEFGTRLFINARTDTYFVPASDPVARFDETVRRARIYVDAGADGIFVPGLESIEEIERMTRAVARPLNIYAGYAGLPPISVLERAGVRRVSLGCGPFQAALALAQRIANETLNDGTYSAMTAQMLSASEVNKLFLKA
jgi:2-methylisocitrate lyase-like PEP mutase family enzyme